MLKTNRYIIQYCFSIMTFLSGIFSFATVAQTRVSHKENDQAFEKNKLVADTNVIIKITYPPLTEREGKGLQIPIPPSEHPRLYLTKSIIPALKEKVNSPLLKDCWSRILASSTLVTDGILKQDSSKSNLDIGVRNAIEAKALMYLFSNDHLTGRQAVDAMLHFYATLKTDLSRPDVCREVGRAIVTGSIVYDWCYPLLTGEEKNILIGRMETLATQLEVEWPKLSQGSVTGHGSEAQLSRDMLSCGIATFNEKPVIYNLVAGRIVSEFVPSRKFFYPAAYHHQGSSYGPYRFNWDMNATFIFDRMGYPEIFGADQRKVPYYFIYSRRPDGQLLRNGDDFNELFSPFGKYWSTGGNANALTGSYFKDPVLIDEALKERTIGKGSDYLFDFLFFDVSIASNITKASLPLTRYFKEPFGAMIARTGWEDGVSSHTVLAEMKVGVYNFVNHQHLDAGSFQLYYRGPLAIQSGIYQGTTGGYGSDHFKNYSQRTIAHNTMLIYDPNEKFIWNGKQVVNDGGQRAPNNTREAKTLQELLQKDYKTGEVLAHAFGPDSIKPEFTYLKGELAEAYSGKVKSFKRSFVFLNLNNSTVPAALIVFDKVVASNKNFKNYWLLHSVEEPAIKGINATIKRVEKGYQGKMINTTLLPVKENLIINKIGGSGREFDVFGINFPQSVNNPGAGSADGAAWRLEVSPKIASVNNLYLNVMQVMDNETFPGVKYAPVTMETDQLTGTKIGDRIVLFSKNGETITDNIHLAFTGKGDYKVLVVDVQKGNWIIKSGKNKSVERQISNEDQLLYFTIKPGNYTLIRNENGNFKK